MHKKFDNQAIEKKWQEKWAANGLYDVTERDTSKEKEYVLVELPYPSGNLHIGHWYAFGVPDIYVRFQRMMGKQVIYPMGFDAFGLPAENAAIKRDINPKEWTEGNIEYMKEQLGNMGNSYTWNMTASTTDPDYYKWTQWMFTQFFEKGIAYRGKGKVNWCPGCNTVIANEQVLPDDTCERSGDKIEKKEMPQWMLKITDYADRLVDDLDGLDWPEHIKEAQRQWIGRSEGAEIDFKLSTDDAMTVFTTRPDTLFGATYMVLAPEHSLVTKNKDQISNWDEVVRYIELTKQKDEQDRLNDTKEKTGVKLEGITATNPASGEEIPVYIADYVLAGYGTGAIMAVPAHDERDSAFAKKFGIDIKQVIEPVSDHPVKAIGAFLIDGNGEILLQKRTADAPTGAGLHGIFGGSIESGETMKQALVREIQEELEIEVEENNIRILYFKESREQGKNLAAAIVSGVDFSKAILHEGEAIVRVKSLAEIDNKDRNHIWETANDDDIHSLYSGVGALYNSAEFNGMSSEEAKKAITEKVGGRMTNTYRLRDWSVGRQRYWGVPIPIVYDPEGKAHPVPKEHLPWILPEDVDFKPTGEPPLAKSAELKKRTEDIFGVGWTPEVETLDTFVDSSWYFMRYIDNQNSESLASLEAQKDWMQVDTYFGGAEHTTMHLLYSRFWQKALYDLGVAVHDEPYKRRINRGLILGPDGNKMSKSKGNVIDPDEQVKLVGADAVKLYLGFMGPYEGTNYPWDMGGIAGIRRFLERLNGLTGHIVEAEPVPVTKQVHKTIIKLREDIPQHKFNTAISAVMVLVNLIEKEGVSKESYRTILQMMAPLAPHLTEELWADLGESNSIHLESFPEADTALAKDELVTIGVQINGKVRGDITIAPDASEEEALAAVADDEQLQKRLTEGEMQKVIYKAGKILNIIVS